MPPQPASRGQRKVALVAAGSFFGYLVIATLLQENDAIRTILIGPYGLSAGLWFLAAIAVLSRLSRREVKASNGAAGTGSSPAFPLAVRFRESGEVWMLESLEDAARSLEWFDGDDPTERADVLDAEGRPVTLKITAHEIVRCAIRES